jgi:Nitrile hydratase beta subunit
MGGTSGWGPTHPPDRDEPVFAEPWQGRAFSLALRWLGALEDLLADSAPGTLTT